MLFAAGFTATNKIYLTLNTQIIILIPLVALATETTTHLEKVCDSGERQLAQATRQAALEAAFADGYQRPLDLMFIIDRSNSIGEIEFNETKSLILKLISFLSEREYILINGEETRIAVVSFGIQATPEFDGISDGRHSADACMFAKRLRDLKLHNSATNQSQIAKALSRAREIFRSSRRHAARTNASQILWLFFDGAEGIPLSYRGRTSGDWSADLRSDGVAIFSVGVGAWLRISIERENRVAELASSNAHYACVETWMDVLTEASKAAPSRNSEFRLSGIAPVYMCGDCPLQFDCVCDVIRMQYTCMDNISRRRQRTWTTRVIALTCSLLVIIALGLGVIWIVVKRRKTTSFIQRRSFYEGPPLSPPLSRHLPSEANTYGSVKVDALSVSDSLSSMPSSQVDSAAHAIALQCHIDYPQTTINQGIEGIN